ncbi:hypothetical protein [Prevotella intermedia]|uniref:hypothetical protein n=1 Tax=Prevotella intermedia TaxID=28131 RepID=UPI0015D51FFB|nr:hypothetical protein [Prevotella intermedia]
MLGTAIGAGLKIAGSIFGGIKASKAMRKYKQQIEQQKQENKSWFDRRYNENATQRADAQAALSNLREHLKRNSENVAGTQAVVGGTEESVAAQKAADANAMSNAVSNINAMGEARKDAIEQQYQEREDGLNAQLGKVQVGRAQNIANAVKGVSDAAAGIAGYVDATEKEKIAKQQNGQQL